MRSMTDLTTWGHACVRFARDGRRLVIDPGAFSDLAVRDDADAVLVPHEHADHVDAGRRVAWAPGEGEWRRVLPLTASRPRRQRHMVGEQLPRFAVAE